jgi:iron complex outermembrane receptor protein
MSTFTTTVRSEVDLDFDPAGYARAKAAFDLEHQPFVTARETFEATELAGRFAAWEASRSIALTANMTLARARFRSGVIGGFDVSGKHVPLVPDTLANAGMTLRIDDRWKLGASAKHVGKQYYDNDQLNSFPSRMPAFNLLDLRLSHERKEWTVSVSANNILNKQYYTYAIRNGAGDSFSAYPQAGRHFLATLQVRMP